MTETLSRPPGQRGPRRPPGRDVEARRPATVAGAAAAVRAVALGLLGVMVVVLVGWATAADSQASAAEAVSAGLVVWLVGHGSQVGIDGGSFTLVPLGLTAVLAALLWTATARVARETRVADARGIAALVSAVSSTYAVLAVLAGLLERTAGPPVSLVSAFGGAAALAVVVSTSATLHASGRSTVLWHRLPWSLRTAVPAAAATVAVLLGGGAAVAGLALSGSASQASSLVDALGVGTGSAVFLTLGSLAAVPNAAVWAAGYATGPGFAVGSGTTVALTGNDVGGVPAVPLLAALPSGPGTGAGWLAVLVPVLAGVVGALVVRRRRPPGHDSTWSRAGVLDDVRVAALVAAGAGLVLAVLAAVSAGSAGPGRMAHVGPTWWLVGLAVALETFLVTTATLVVLRRR